MLVSWQGSTQQQKQPSPFKWRCYKDSLQKDVFKYVQPFLNTAVMNDIAEHVASSTLLIKPVSVKYAISHPSLTQVENNLSKWRRVKLTTIMSFLYSASHSDFPKPSRCKVYTVGGQSNFKKQCIFPSNNMLKGIWSYLFHFSLIFTGHNYSTWL